MTDRNIIELNETFSNDIQRQVRAADLKDGSAEATVAGTLCVALWNLKDNTLQAKKNARQTAARIADMLEHGRLINDSDWLVNDARDTHNDALKAKEAERTVIYNLRLMKQLGWFEELDLTNACFVNKF